MCPSLERRLPLVGTYNVRDVGGYPTADGGYIRWETPALVHCTAGKDRTGMVIALRLSAIGVSDEDVCADSALSASFLTGTYLDEARERAAGLGLGEEMLSAQYASEPEWMAHVLALVLERFGGADAYLLHHGLTRGQLDALHHGLTDHTSLEGSTS
jgi:protein-tyrosine phosphatase